MRSVSRSFATGLIAAGAFALVAVAQHTGHDMPHGAGGNSGRQMDSMPMAFGPIEDSQDASGTAWQPSATPMHAHHAMRGNWQVMTHYNVFLAYDDQSGPRGGEQFNSVNWFMVMASKREADQDLTLRAMLSLEPWSTSKRGYPLLFQSGEAYLG